MTLRRILKLAPGRDDRRLLHTARGHEELRSLLTSYGISYGQLCRWGLLEQHAPVDFLDAYDGHRPTKAGLDYFLYEEEYHLILCRKSRVQVLKDRAEQELKVRYEGALASFAAEVQEAVRHGWQPDLSPGPDARKSAVEQAYVHKGYLPLEQFMTRHGLSTEGLIVAGVLRYKRTRAANGDALLVVGNKAKPCLLLSTHWQMILVKPGMEQSLLKLCAVVGF